MSLIKQAIQAAITVTQTNGNRDMKYFDGLFKAFKAAAQTDKISTSMYNTPRWLPETTNPNYWQLKFAVLDGAGSLYCTIMLLFKDGSFGYTLSGYRLLFSAPNPSATSESSASMQLLDRSYFPEKGLENSKNLINTILTTFKIEATKLKLLPKFDPKQADLYQELKESIMRRFLDSDPNWIPGVTYVHSNRLRIANWKVVPSDESKPVESCRRLYAQEVFNSLASGKDGIFKVNYLCLDDLANPKTLVNTLKETVAASDFFKFDLLKVTLDDISLSGSQLTLTFRVKSK